MAKESPKDLPKKQPGPLPENAGILKQKEREDFEREVVEKLRIIGKRLTKKEASELLAKIEASKSIESLKAQLAGGKEEHDKALEMLVSLYETIRKGAKEGIKELRVDLEKILAPSMRVRKKGSNFSNRFAFTEKLERSELGKSLVLDVAGISIGILDSLIDAIAVIYASILGLLRLPKDLREDWKNRNDS